MERSWGTLSGGVWQVTRAQTFLSKLKALFANFLLHPKTWTSLTFLRRMQKNCRPFLKVFGMLMIFFDSQSTTVEKERPLEVDAGLLTVTDLNPIDEETYK